jgi:hypothetical protein
LDKASVVDRNVAGVAFVAEGLDELLGDVDVGLLEGLAATCLAEDADAVDDGVGALDERCGAGRGVGLALGRW